jgi:hypothetical protein
MVRFGLEMSDGQRKIGRYDEDLQCQATLPDSIRKIEMYIKQNMWSFHSIVFYGETTLQVGLTLEDDANQKSLDHKRGNIKTFNVPYGHELLGCILHHDYDTYGV